MKPHPSQPWEVRPQSLGWVRMGTHGDTWGYWVHGTWYKVHGILLSFSVPDVIQPTSGTQHGYWLTTTLTIGHLQRVGDMCVASAWD